MILTAGVVSGNGSQPRCPQEATLGRFYLNEASCVLDHKERQTQKAVEAHPFLQSGSTAERLPSGSKKSRLMSPGTPEAAAC